MSDRPTLIGGNMVRDLDYKGIMVAIGSILAREEAAEHKMSRHWIEGEILVVIQKYDAKRKPKKVY